MAPLRWRVLWHQDAVVELNQVKDQRSRRAALAVADVLRGGGDRLAEPHCKKVQGTGGLFELRPGGGRVPVRPLYARIDRRTFIILAVAPEALVDPRGFTSAVARARERARADYERSV